MKVARTALLGLFAAASLTASLSAASAATGLVMLRVCNHTGAIVLIAGSFIPVGGNEWKNKGWTAVGAGGCRDIFTTPNRTFYARAEVKGHSDQYWGNDIKQCVEYPGPYDFMTRSEDTTCPEGEPAAFTTFRSDGRPVYVWNLNP